MQWKPEDAERKEWDLTLQKQSNDDLHSKVVYLCRHIFEGLGIYQLRTSKEEKKN